MYEGHSRCASGVVGHIWSELWVTRGVRNLIDSRIVLERRARVGDSPVGEIGKTPWYMYPSTTGHVKPCGNLCRPRHKAKYASATDSEPVP